jgi:hypothetical protein
MTSCQGCGTTPVRDARFCTACGRPTGAAPQPAGTATQPTGAAPQPTGAATQPTGAATQPTGAAPQPTGTATQPTGAARELTGTVTPETIQLLAGRSADHYVRAFGRMYPDGSVALKPSWNWAAFLFGALWLLYRGLLLEAFAIWSVVGAFGVAHVPLCPLAMLGQGIFGNAIYFRALERRTRRATPIAA